MKNLQNKPTLALFLQKGYEELIKNIFKESKDCRK